MISERIRSASLGWTRGHRAVRAHASGVGTRIVIEHALVILRDLTSNDRRPVGEGNERRLLTVEKLLYDDLRSGIAKRAPLDPIAYRLDGLVSIGCNEDALSGGKAVRLDDVRGAELIHERNGLVDLVEDLPASARHASTVHQLSCVRLRSLDMGRVRVRPEDLEALPAESVPDSGNERSLRADYHEVRVHLACGFDRDRRCKRVPIEHLGETRDARVAGGGEHARDRR